MSEATGSAAQALAGNPAEGTPAAAATATTALTTPAPGATPPPAGALPTAESPPTAPEWFTKLPEPVRVLAEAKGWKSEDPGEAFAKAGESYANLEKLLGAGEKLVLPKDASDQAGWDKVWNRLGRPENAEGYGFDKIEGADPKYAKHMSEALYKAGAPASIAKAAVEAHQAFLTQSRQEATTALETQGAADIEMLKTQWGATYDAQMEGARRVVKADGLSAEDLSALESVWGTKKTLEYFARRGAEVLEDQNAPRDALAPRGGLLTPDAAKAEITRKTADPEFLKRYMSEDPKVRSVAIAEMERLQKLSVGEKA